MNKLKHIALILDGNRRWAVKNNLEKLQGHTRGAENVVKIIDYIYTHTDIQYITLYAFSRDNFKRSAAELAWLFDLFESSILKFLTSDVNKNISIRFIGERDQLPESLSTLMTSIEEKTKNNKKLEVLIAIDYSSRIEITNAAKKLSQLVLEKKITPEQITAQLFAEQLYTTGVPDPDVLIRTSEVRLSDFLLWQLSYSELFFIDKFWPDFSVLDLQIIIDDFNNRHRRHGG